VAPLAGDDGQLAVAVDDLSTGADAAYSGTQEFVTASIVKVDILSALLCQAHRHRRVLGADHHHRR
jgi:beta-lactamase class A